MNLDLAARCVVLVRPKQPYIDWANRQTAPDEPSYTPDIHGTTAFLVPDFDTPEEVKGWLEKHYDMIFIDYLDGWMRDETIWPKDRTFRMFQEWFEIEIHEMVFDLVKEMEEGEE